MSPRGGGHRYVILTRERVFAASTVKVGKRVQGVAAAAKANVMAHLAAHSNGDGVGWPSQALLAAETGLSVGTVHRTLLALVDDGLINREACYGPDGARDSDRITFVVEALEALPLASDVAATTRAQRDQSPPTTRAQRDQSTRAERDQSTRAQRDVSGHSRSEQYRSGQPAWSAGPPTEKQIGRLATLTRNCDREWDEDEARALTGGQVSEKISELERVAANQEEISRLAKLLDEQVPWDDLGGERDQQIRERLAELGDPSHLFRECVRCRWRMPGGHLNSDAVCLVCTGQIGGRIAGMVPPNDDDHATERVS